MRLRPSVLGLIVATILVAGARAQERPNFAGRWIPTGPGSQPAQPLLVSQTATTLTVENWSTSGPSSGIHRWGQHPQQLTATMPSGWDGTTLVITFPVSILANAPNPSAVRTESWSLDRTGKLTITIELRRNEGPRQLDTFLYSRADRE
jgi:hypothetical protein